MKLLQVGRDKWTVLVVADDGWRSPVLSLEIRTWIPPEELQ